ncbi:MAG: hypothetical protein ABI614_12510 [Planctomycetota bacterium]
MRRPIELTDVYVPELVQPCRPRAASSESPAISPVVRHQATDPEFPHTLHQPPQHRQASRTGPDAPRLRQLLVTLVEMVRDFGSAALAEGVETQAEHEVCCEIGFEFGQGYFDGRPQPREQVIAGHGTATPVGI